MTTKFQVMISLTDDDNVIVEGRTQKGLKTKVLKKDENINAAVGEAIMSFAPPIQQPPA